MKTLQVHRRKSVQSQPRIITYLTKKHLLALRKLEREYQASTGTDLAFSWAIADDYLRKLDPSLRLIVVDWFYHKGSGPCEQIIRATILISTTGERVNRKGQVVWAIVDMPADMFDLLPQEELLAA